MSTETRTDAVRARLPQAVVALGVVSLFTDISSEMIYPLLPLFLSGVLGAGALALGVIEGVAESTASLLKVYSGFRTDRSGRRLPLMVAGYGLAGLVRPLIGLATVWPFVLGMRFLDRVGKGLRTSPRDALIADVTDPAARGRAYGFHRSMDHAGAVVGPLIAASLLWLPGMSLRHVFLLAAIPAAAVMVVLLAWVREPGRTASESGLRPAGLMEPWRQLGSNFQWLLLALLIFTLGNSADAFLLLGLSQSGVPAAWVALLWSLHHVVKMTSTYLGGTMSDRFGCRRMILCGWAVYAAVYLAFGLTESMAMKIGLFMVYGIYFGLTEPAEKAWIARLVPAHLRGTAFGCYHGAIGLGALPASLLFGWLWQTWGAATAFATGAGLALAACLALAGTVTE